MQQIVITGAVTSGGADRTALYSTLVEICQPHAKKVYSPLDVMVFRGTNEERYQRAVTLVESADLLIAESSLPSTGQGIDIQEANRDGVPILILAEKNSKVSGLVLGSPMIKAVIYYDDIDHLKRVLDEKLSGRDSGLVKE
jgi:hypothetical protein